MLVAGCAGIDASKFNLAVQSTDKPAGDGESRGLLGKLRDPPPRTKEAIEDFDRRRNDAQFLAAETSWRQGDAKRCREALEKVLARDSAHRGAVLLLADVHLEASQSAEAVEVLERGIAALPGDAEIAYKLGVALEADGQTVESRHWLAQAAAKDPENERYRSALAQAKDESATENSLTTSGDSGSKVVASVDSKAKPAVKAVDGSPANSDAAPTGVAGAGKGSSVIPLPPLSDDDDGTSASAPAVAATPAPAATRSDAAFQAALADWDAGRREACEARLRVLLADDPEHVDAAVLMTEVELSSDRQAEARARIEHLVIRNPNDPRVRRACALTYDALGEKELAESCYSKAEQLEAQPQARTLTHREATSARNYTSGAASVGGEPRRLNVAVLETLPVPGVDASGGIMPVEGAGDVPSTEPATADQKAVDSRKRGSPNGRNDGSAVPPAPSVLRFEADENALPTASRSGDEAGPPEELARLSPAELLDRGTAALVAGQIDAAGEAFREAIRRDRKNSQTAVTAAVAALKHEQPELALQLAKFALESLPRSAGLHRIFGTAAYQLGRYAEAESALRQSLSLDNSQALSYFLLGSVQSRLGKHEAAEGQFRHAAKLDRRYAVRR
jgi:tetratricopeptide (TPR) repeat protein